MAGNGNYLYLERPDFQLIAVLNRNCMLIPYYPVYRVNSGIVNSPESTQPVNVVKMVMGDQHPPDIKIIAFYKLNNLPVHASRIDNDRVPVFPIRPQYIAVTEAIDAIVETELHLFLSDFE
jgi:hypothetical protein